MFYRESGNLDPPQGTSRAAARKRALRELVENGRIPGLIGYRGGMPVGWVSLAPRHEYAKLQRSPVMKPVDDKPVWSVVCFFVHPRHRGAGISEALLEAATRYARSRGAELLEAYPVDKPQRSAAENMWFGAKQMYDRAGFREMARRKPARPVVRKRLRAGAVRTSR